LPLENECNHIQKEPGKFDSMIVPSLTDDKVEPIRAHNQGPGKATSPADLGPTPEQKAIALATAIKERDLTKEKGK
jgi:hypothetical protein